MPAYQEFLAKLRRDPSDLTVLAELESLGSELMAEEAWQEIADVRETLREWGQLEAVERLFDIQLAAATDDSMRADVLLAKGQLYVDELLDGATAQECLERVLTLRPEDPEAAELLSRLSDMEARWEAFRDQFREEAEGAGDPALASSQFVLAAETCARHDPDGEGCEEFLERALEVDPGNRRAASHMERLLRREGRWLELVDFYRERADRDVGSEKMRMLINLADVAMERLGDEEGAIEAMQQVLLVDPLHPRAIEVLRGIYERRGDSEKLAALDQTREARPASTTIPDASLPAAAEEEAGASDADDKQVVPAEEDPAQVAADAPAAVGGAKTLADLQKAWRQDPADDSIRAALKDAYAEAGRWNAMLEVLRSELSLVPSDDIAGQVAVQLEIVALYRDELGIDTMVTNTYKAILAIDPTNAEAQDVLVEKFREQSRWSDLVAVLERKAERPDTSDAERVALWREVSTLWSERFRNFAKAAEPLSRILEANPADTDAFVALRDIYEKRRQWPELVDLLAEAVAHAPEEERTARWLEVAQLASERIRDAARGAEIWQATLQAANDAGDQDVERQALAALARLYERQQRFQELADIYRRQAEGLGDGERLPVLEKQAALLGDRLGLRDEAAAVHEEILALAPDNARSLRALRAHYADAEDLPGLERLFSQRGQWEELLSSLYSLVDRTDDKDRQLELLLKAAQVAAEQFDRPERATRAYERVLSADPDNELAARALVPLYEGARKWNRLLAMHEVLYRQASDETEQRDCIAKIRGLCERLSVPSQGFRWALAAFELGPRNDGLIDDVLRLGEMAGELQQIEEAFLAVVSNDATGDDERVVLRTRLAELARRKRDGAKRREHLLAVLDIVPGHSHALTALEQLAGEEGDSALLAEVLERQAANGEDTARFSYLMRLAGVQKDQLDDAEAAMATYRSATELCPDQRAPRRALLELARSAEAWEVAEEAAHALLETARDDSEAQSLHLTLASVSRDRLGDLEKAVAHYQEALSFGACAEARGALESVLENGSGPAQVKAAETLLPMYEREDRPKEIASALTVLRETAPPEESAAMDRRLMQLFGGRLSDQERAFQAGLRAMETEPAHLKTRDRVRQLSLELGQEQAFATALQRLLDSDVPDDVRYRLGVDLAGFLAEGMGDIAGAEERWRSLYDKHPRASSVIEGLERLYAQNDRAEELAAFLRQRIELADEPDENLLLRLAELSWGPLEDPLATETACRTVLELHPGHERALELLDLSLGKLGKTEELEALLATRQQAADEAQGLLFLRRRAALLVEEEGRAEDCFSLCEQLLAREPSCEDAREHLESLSEDSPVAARALERLQTVYESDGAWVDACRIVRRRLERGEGERAALLFLVAELCELRLGDEAAACDAWLELADVDPTRLADPTPLLRTARAQGRYAAAAGALEGVATAVVQPRAVLEALAAVYEHELSDSEKAISAHMRLYDLAPDDDGVAKPAAAALVRLYARVCDWDALVGFYRRLADSSSGEEQVDWLRKAARLTQERFEDKDAREIAWRNVLAAQADDGEALGALEMHYETAGMHAELIGVLQRRVGLAKSAHERRAYRLRIATLFEDNLHDREGAIGAWEGVREELPADGDALLALTRLYRETDNPSALFEVLSQRRELAADEHMRRELAHDAACLLVDSLDNAADALLLWQDVLTEQPDHDAARERVERLLVDETLSGAAMDVLVRACETVGDWGQLARLWTSHAERTGDAASWARVADLRETRLGDLDAAFEARERALCSALRGQEVHATFSHFVRLGDAVGGAERILRVLGDLVAEEELAPIRGDVHAEMARRAEELGRPEEATRQLRECVALGYRVDETYGHLARLLGSQGLAADEYDVLLAWADASARESERRGHLAAAARLAAGELDRPDAARELWERIREEDASHEEAESALEELYEKASDWDALANLWDQRLSRGGGSVALRARLAGLYADRLDQPTLALSHFALIVSEQPDHHAAMGWLEEQLGGYRLAEEAGQVLEPIYIAAHEWSKLVNLYEVRLNHASDDAERLGLSERIATLYEEQLEDLSGAFDCYQRLYVVVPSERVRAHLERLAGVLDDWAGLARGLEQAFERHPESVQVLQALAFVYDARLDDAGGASRAYEELLARDPGAGATARSYAALLSRHERWESLVEFQGRAADSASTDEQRVALLLAQARVYEECLEDNAKAIESLRAARDQDAACQPAISALERLYVATADWSALRELLEERVLVAPTVAEEGALRLRLAEVLETHLSASDAAIDQYEVCLSIPPAASGAVGALEQLVVRDDHRDRVSAMLEPVYRQQDAWAKLVVILEARLAYAETDADEITMLREIAHLHEVRGGSAERAAHAMARAWQKDLRDEEMYAALSALAAKVAGWDLLVSAIDDALASGVDSEMELVLHARSAGIHEQQRGDDEAALASWRAARSVAEDDEVALAGLDRILSRQDPAREHVEVLSRRVELAASDVERKTLLVRLAELARAVDDWALTVDALEKALELDASDESVMMSLEDAHRCREQWPELASVLERRIEVCSAPALRRQLRLEVADLYAHALVQPDEAVIHYLSLLDEVPEDTEALTALGGLYRREERWADLLDILDRQLEMATTLEQRAEFGYQAARLLAEKLAEPVFAVERVGQVVEVLPTHAGARELLCELLENRDTLTTAAAILERLYRSEQDAERLVALFELRLEEGDALDEGRLADFASLADIHETLRGDGVAALEVWARALSEQPDAHDVRGHLERLAESTGAWAKLAGVYERVMADCSPALEYNFAMRLGQIRVGALADAEGACHAYERALDIADDERQPLEALTELYEQMGRYADMAQLLVRHVDAESDPLTQTVLLFRASQVHEQRLGDVEGAIELYREVLDRDSTHNATRAALGRLIADERYRVRVVEMLEPLVLAEGEPQNMIGLLSHKLSYTVDANQRAEIYATIAELAERGLRDYVRCMEALGAWLAEDPGCDDALFELLRVSNLAHRQRDAAGILQGIIEASQWSGAAMFLALGGLYLGALGDLDAAETIYESVLENDPGQEEALEALEQVYRRKRDGQKLGDILVRRAEGSFDSGVKRACHAEVALIKEQAGDLSGAVSAWKEVIEIDMSDRDANAHLAALYRRMEMWPALVEQLRNAAQCAPHVSEEIRLRTELARLVQGMIRDADAAREAWTALLDIAPDSEEAMTALEEILLQQEDWPALMELLDRRIDKAGPETAAEILVRCAWVTEEKLGSLDDAADFLQRALEAKADHVIAAQQLERVFAECERYDDLVELLEWRAQGPLLSAPGEAADALVRAAEVLDKNLGSQAGAKECLNRALELAPEFVPALLALADLHEAEGEWGKAQTVLERALGLRPAGRHAADLFVRLGAAARNRGAPDTEIRNYLVKALEYDHKHAHAIAELESYAREAGDWSTVADMLARRAETAGGEPERLPLALELADICIERFQQPEWALAYLEEARPHFPDDPTLAKALARTYKALGRATEAASLFAPLIAEAKQKRQMKLVAQYLHEQGALYVEMGDSAQAKKLWEEAYRVDPTSVFVTAGLARLCVASQDWDAARRYLRALTLKDLPQELGITKAEVYLELGRVQVRLGDLVSAKNMFRRGLEIDRRHGDLQEELSRLAETTDIESPPAPERADEETDVD